MRIAYGIHGYGRGHATRALAVLPELKKRHDILILAGGDAYDLLCPDYMVQRIPTLRYYYGNKSERSTRQTIARNFPSFLDLYMNGPSFENVCEILEHFKPDVVISDAEVWSLRAAGQLGIPRIAFNHFGILVYCTPKVSWRDKIDLFLEMWTYRYLMGRPDRAVVSSFYRRPPKFDGVRLVGTLLRPEITQTKPTRGEHLLVYLNKGQHQFTPRIEQALHGLEIPVRIYGADQRRSYDNLTFRPLSNLPFVEDLASARAVLSTAGNQLVGEAVYFGKPMLVIPEKTVEQRLNAGALEDLGIGRQIALKDVCIESIRNFLDAEKTYRDNLRHVSADGSAEAIEAIETFMRELAAERDAEPAPELSST